MDTLGQLIEPSPISFTPEAPGWKVMLLLLLAVIFLISLAWWFYYRKNRYRQIAIQFLQDLESATGKTHLSLVYSANMLLKRIAMQQYGRERTAGLREQEWLDFLNATGKSVGFDEEDRKLLSLLYENSKTIEENQIQAFIVKTKQWIKTHKNVFKPV